MRKCTRISYVSFMLKKKRSLRCRATKETVLWGNRIVIPEATLEIHSRFSAEFAPIILQIFHLLRSDALSRNYF